MPFLKSMDPVEGRDLATWEMLPRWRGFVNETEETNMSAWNAVLVISDLAYCMTQTLMEEDGRVFKNVPSSYDFTRVSEGFFLPTSTNKLSVYYFILIENDNLGDWSPEKDCFWWLTFRQPVRKPSSESTPTTVLLRTRTPGTQTIIFNEGISILGASHFLIHYFMLSPIFLVNTSVYFRVTLILLLTYGGRFSRFFFYLRPSLKLLSKLVNVNGKLP